MLVITVTCLLVGEAWRKWLHFKGIVHSSVEIWGKANCINLLDIPTSLFTPITNIWLIGPNIYGDTWHLMQWIYDFWLTHFTLKKRSHTKSNARCGISIPNFLFNLWINWPYRKVRGQIWLHKFVSHTYFPIYTKYKYFTYWQNVWLLMDISPMIYSNDLWPTWFIMNERSQVKSTLYFGIPISSFLLDPNGLMDINSLLDLQHLGR